MTSIVRREKHLSSKSRRAVLTLSTKKRHQGTVRRHFLMWREAHGLPVRCDEPLCQFHRGPLEWNGRPLTLILDHKDGNRVDNLPSSLRLLCPNCDSQPATRGGRNRCRVVGVVEGGYTLRNRDGSIVETATGRAAGVGRAIVFATAARSKGETREASTVVNTKFG